jgi:uncharacterized protein YcfJ
MVETIVRDEVVPEEPDPTEAAAESDAPLEAASRIDARDDPLFVLGRPVEDRSFEVVEASAGMVAGLVLGTAVGGPVGMAVGGLVGAAAGLAAGEALERHEGAAAASTDATEAQPAGHR